MDPGILNTLPPLSGFSSVQYSNNQDITFGIATSVTPSTNEGSDVSEKARIDLQPRLIENGKMKHIVEGCSRFSEKLFKRYSRQISLMAQKSPLYLEDGEKIISDEFFIRIVSSLMIEVKSTIHLAVCLSLIEYFLLENKASLPSIKLFDFIPRLLNLPISVENTTNNGFMSPQPSLTSQISSYTNVSSQSGSQCPINRSGNSVLPSTLDIDCCLNKQYINKMTCGICNSFVIRGANAFSAENYKGTCKCQNGIVICSECLYKWLKQIGVTIDISMCSKIISESINTLPFVLKTCKSMNKLSDENSVFSSVMFAFKKIQTVAEQLNDIIPHCPFGCDTKNVFIAADADFMELTKAANTTITFLCPLCKTKDEVFTSLDKLSIHIKACEISNMLKPETIVLKEIEGAPGTKAETISELIEDKNRGLILALNQLIISQNKIQTASLNECAVISNMIDNVESKITDKLIEIKSESAMTKNSNLAFGQKINAKVDSSIKDLQRYIKVNVEEPISQTVSALDNKINTVSTIVSKLNESKKDESDTLVEEIKEIKKSLEDFEKRITDRCNEVEKKTTLLIKKNSRAKRCKCIKTFLFITIITSVLCAIAFYPEIVVDYYDRLLDKKLPDFISKIPAVKYFINHENEIIKNLENVE